MSMLSRSDLDERFALQYQEAENRVASEIQSRLALLR